MAEEKKNLYDIIGDVSRLTALANAYAPKDVTYHFTLEKNLFMVAKFAPGEDGKEKILWKEESFTWEDHAEKLVNRLLREIAANLELDLKERRE